MQAREVYVGGRYVAKVGGRYVIVQITEADGGSFRGVSERTGRTVRFKSARRLSHMDGGPMNQSQVRTMTDSRVIRDERP